MTQPLVVVLATLAIHTVLLVQDYATGFQAFAWGDRGQQRLDALNGMAHLQSGLVTRMVDANVVPGEYLFALPFWLAGGAGAVVLVQVVLAALSAGMVARLGEMLGNFRLAPLVCGLAYALIPQNLAYPHQLVTEAFATPFCVAWLYFAFQATQTRRTAHFGLAGLCLGLAIFVRPSLVLILAAAIFFLAVVRATRQFLRTGGFALMAALALAPLLAWTAVFSAATGTFGYTRGIANLGWNLESKALITEQANGIEPAPILLDPVTGIGTGQFLHEAWAHKPAFARAALIDTATVFLKGNSTKFTIDYLGISRDQKNWRERLIYGKPSGARWREKLSDPLYVTEFIFSALMTALFLVVALACLRTVIQSRGVTAASPRFAQLVFSVLTLALLANVLVSAQIVDQSQARLRNPAEAAMVIQAAIALGALWQARQRRRVAGP